MLGSGDSLERYKLVLISELGNSKTSMWCLGSENRGTFRSFPCPEHRQSRRIAEKRLHGVFRKMEPQTAPESPGPRCQVRTDKWTPEPQSTVWEEQRGAGPKELHGPAGGHLLYNRQGTLAEAREGKGEAVDAVW